MTKPYCGSDLDWCEKWWPFLGAVILCTLLVAAALFIAKSIEYENVPQHQIVTIEGHQYIKFTSVAVVHSESCTNSIHNR